MDALDQSLVQTALSGYVGGTTLQIVRDGAGVLAGATAHGVNTACDLTAYADATVDSIVAAWSVEHVDDAVAAITQWRRALREGGHLAVVLRDASAAVDGARHAYSVDAWQSLLHAVGGFEVVRVAQLDAGNGWLVVAGRHAMSDLKNLLGSHGSALADAAQQSAEHVAELCFHFGTILLRAGETRAARPCFESMLEHVPDDAEGLFGLGMCHALDKRWSDAVSWLTRAVDRNAENGEAKRWLGLAQLELDATPPDVGPQSARRHPE